MATVEYETNTCEGVDMSVASLDVLLNVRGSLADSDLNDPGAQGIFESARSFADQQFALPGGRVWVDRQTSGPEGRVNERYRARGPNGEVLFLTSRDIRLPGGQFVSQITLEGYRQDDPTARKNAVALSQVETINLWNKLLVAPADARASLE